MIDFVEFKALFAGAGVAVNDEQYRKFSEYADMLAEKNKIMNLTAITEPREVAEKHFLDSVLPLRLFEVDEGARLADVGAGAGFPSLPLGIMRPDLKLTMIDSLQKRVNFLKETTQRLGIPADCRHLRAEEAGRGELRESFDVVTARAVSRMSTLCEYCLPLTKVGGVFLAMKGGDCKAELDEATGIIEALTGAVEDIIGYKLPNGDRRTLVVLRKKGKTPGKYPRPAGKIGKT